MYIFIWFRSTMASSQSQPGYEALGLNEIQVTLTIRNNLNEVAKFLMDEKIIKRSIYSQVTDPESRSTVDILAQIVFRELRNKVEEDDEIYKKFVEYLRNEIASKKTVTELDHSYDKQLKQIMNESKLKISTVTLAI